MGRFGRQGKFGDLSKTILAIHDLSGWGHTSLMASIPILYYCGFQVAVLPSAVLSTNTDYPGYQMTDLSSQMQASISHWQSMQVSFDAIYSGFLASSVEVELLRDAIHRFRKPDAPVLIDPVLGDSGQLYSCYEPSMVEAMRRIIPLADYITPNLSEACLLLDRPYKPDISPEEAFAYCRALQDMGAKTVIITSAATPKPGYSALVALDSAGKDYYRECRYLPSACPGAGDIFTTILLAGILHKLDLKAAIDRAASFVFEGIRIALDSGEPPQKGIPLQRCLHLLD